MVLAEATNGQTLRYWHGLGLVAQSDGTQTEYFAYDGLGSVRQVTDSAGSPLMAQTFDPYGNPYVSAGPQESNFGYSGEYEDDNGLLFLRARYYDARQGRFFQMDPSRQERNPYQYGLGNPVNFTDPFGLSRCGSAFGAGLLICITQLRDELYQGAQKANALGTLYPQSGLTSMGTVMLHYLAATGSDLRLNWSYLGHGYQQVIQERVQSYLQAYFLLHPDEFSTISNACNGERGDIVGAFDFRQADAEVSTNEPTFDLNDPPPWYVFLQSIGKEDAYSPFVFGNEAYDPYYLAFGTGSIVSVGRTRWERVTMLGQNRVVIHTAIEFFDHYDWCYGDASCETEDTHPGGVSAGDMFALESNSLAKQFSIYSYGIVRITLTFNGTNQIDISSSSWSASSDIGLFMSLVNLGDLPVQTYSAEEGLDE